MWALCRLGAGVQLNLKSELIELVQSSCYGSGYEEFTSSDTVNSELGIRLGLMNLKPGTTPWTAHLLDLGLLLFCILLRLSRQLLQVLACELQRKRNIFSAF